ncbi:MAG TPA: tetratricopeptide repeat protein [Leptospiraceae bacterium]|nr:tetratricopeptide repeat protein [Leptospiraceae bacterium]HMW05458.1 tetratricopeptide repeat protein [Leptospiraceae bacterium]HMX31393.1 tetratricopeptide repeat protein [Leptospiraceae bacterium]HMY30968.1 tetratricopeptide repeat protein [Leptospiraceae bacterium]HMZ63379.1 tetratricopeptide repeat protein [Leptospiraceae bacterium]
MPTFLRIFLTFTILFQIPLLAGMKEAKKAYAQKQFQKAIKLFTEYTKENPSDGEPYMYMGYIYESQKDFPRSMMMFRKAVELNLNPKHRKTSYLKIILFYHYHQGWDIVAHYANKFLRLDPENKEVARMRDRAYANKGHDPGVISFARPEDIAKAKQKKNSEETEKLAANKEKPQEKEEPSQPKSSETPSRKTSEEKKWELSLKYFQQEDYQKADKIMQELVLQNPNNKNYLYKAGIAKLRLGEYEKALKYFESSKKLTDEDDKMLRYYITLNEGQANHKLGNTNTAIALYKKAYSINPSNLILPVLTRLYYENSYFEEVLKTSDQIPETDQNKLEANMYKSLALIQTGKKRSGMKSLLDFAKKIKRIYPDINTIPEKFHEGLLQIGFFYSNRIKYKLSLKYLTLVSSSKSKSSKFNFALGKTYFYTKKFDLALVFLEKVPEISAANYLLAKYYAKENNLIKTKEYLSKATAKKEIYWIKVKIDPYFKDLNSNPEFMTFVETKGGKISPAKQDLPITNEKKIETNIPKIEPPATKPETVPTKDMNPSTETAPTPNLPQNTEN